MRRLAPLALLLVLSACGSREVAVSAHDALAAGAVAPAPRRSIQQSDPSAPAAPVVSTVKSDAAPKGTRDTPRGSKGLASHSNIPLAVSLERDCVTPGETMRATAVTLKNAGLGFTASYADNRQVPDFTFVPRDANPTGTFTWTWVVQPTISPGDALLTVVSYTDNAHSATFETTFRVAQQC